MSELIVITFDSEEKGLGALAQVGAQELELQDAAVSVRNEDGRSGTADIRTQHYG